MGCMIARGHIDEETLEITIPEQTLIPFDVPRFVDNMSYESLVIKGDRVYGLFEAYGDSLIKDPYVLSVNVSGKDTIKKHQNFIKKNNLLVNRGGGICFKGECPDC